MRPWLALLPQCKSMIPTEKKADMELKLWLSKKYNRNTQFIIFLSAADHVRPEPWGLIRRSRVICDPLDLGNPKNMDDHLLHNNKYCIITNITYELARSLKLTGHICSRSWSTVISYLQLDWKNQCHWSFFILKVSHLAQEGLNLHIETLISRFILNQCLDPWRGQ